tara:strand:- start:122 stop:379 length:258 start_codon:yes stop_codon:yes gene_type:complete
MSPTKICNIHKKEMEVKKVSALLGYPVPVVFDVDNMFPNHGLWSGLGGCVIEMDENGEVTNENEEDVEVCSECYEAAEKYLDEHN